jgi:GntR family transcriptional regulator
MKQNIKAINMSKKEAEMLLGKAKGFGLVSLKTIYNEDEDPIEYTKTIYNPDRYSFNMIFFNTNH